MRMRIYFPWVCIYATKEAWQHCAADVRSFKINMAAQRQLRALRNDGNLRRFVVQARPTGRQLGTGSYGAVEEVV